MSALSKWTGRRKGLELNYTVDRSSGESSPFFVSTRSTTDDGSDGSYEGRITSAYRANGIVFACITARQMPFSEARFQYQEIADGTPGKLSNGTGAQAKGLDLLSRPFGPTSSTGQLLARMELDVSLAGNFYATKNRAGVLQVLRPDWIRTVSGVQDGPASVRHHSVHELESVLLHYVYAPPGADATIIMPEDMVHFAPYPDPLHPHRGMSWLTPLAREIKADGYATDHKLKFFENGAALGTAIVYDADIDPDEFDKYVELFESRHAGPQGAYKTLHVGGGSTIETIGTELKTDFRAIQGAGETRIAAAAGVGAIMARFSEGLAGSSLNAGNYSAAKRQFADMTIRPLWRGAASALEAVAKPGPDERLWYDVSDVEFLKEDRKDAAEIRKASADTMAILVQAGYTPESVSTAIETDDLKRLEHSGLYSVQLRPGTLDGELDKSQAVAAVGVLVRSGFDPEAACVAMGLDPIAHTGRVPAAVQSPEAADAVPAGMTQPNESE